MRLFAKHQPPLMQTERLILRPWRIRDARDFYAYAKDPRVGPPAGWPPHTSIFQSYLVIRNYRRQKYIWAIQHKASNKVIGCVGIYHDGNRTEPQDIHRELGFSMSPAYWGHGLMSEACRQVMVFAFTELKLDEMTIYHFCDNENSRRVAQKLGFSFRFKMRNALRTWDGVYHDCMAYHMTAADYFALMSVQQESQETQSGV